MILIQLLCEVANKVVNASKYLTKNDNGLTSKMDWECLDESYILEEENSLWINRLVSGYKIGQITQGRVVFVLQARSKNGLNHL